MRKLFPALLIALLAGTSAAAAAPKVVVSILPLQALAAGVMDGVGTPELLLSGQNSEHNASFSPQQIKLLGEADLVFIIGKGLELKLDEISGSEAVNGKAFVALADTPGLTRLPVRQGGTWEAHHHHDDEAEGEGHEDGHAEGEDHDHDDDHGKAAFDPHLWLDPENARLMVRAIAADLAKADPANTAQYESNANKMLIDLDALEAEIGKSLEPVKDKPFVVFHDAYQYFERRFGLQAAGSISDVSANAPSAQRLQQVRQKLKDTKATCVFREPQFSDKAVQVIIEGTDAREGVLDPIGATLQPGKDAYRELLTNLAGSLKACLSGG
ncbi:MAG: zinc ABC transporter substrate-binding protein [Proteobacteria bacterium]|nr:zinc ABC transporter substrate-binding protein [Pseudomonadota bacterium]